MKKILALIVSVALCVTDVCAMPKNELIPVSYTHLDVYKRQYCDSRGTDVSDTYGT